MSGSWAWANTKPLRRRADTTVGNILNLHGCLATASRASRTRDASWVACHLETTACHLYNYVSALPFAAGENRRVQKGYSNMDHLDIVAPAGHIDIVVNVQSRNRLILMRLYAGMGNL